ncbi:MAG: hypothetical protein LBC30_01565 [Puniceicoccales bacterium]|nr:hypothetical protein [Puniceicoccales bacterium]
MKKGRRTQSVQGCGQLVRKPVERQADALKTGNSVVVVITRRVGISPSKVPEGLA